ncbi:hypothetical protein LEP1GSC047_0340 [Leptospira inadai serovar Lyme str. 10]|uniref:Uncharacterized protein n=1 Tax=Leptospira inadai serovar Lyme str. 10 TaxID=1049790 RepID=V6HBA8_9LEPT|nr:hypothetical protein LEP1GSC047_0340 [Leptospira inadai serovar Lyme str. 10]
MRINPTSRVLKIFKLNFHLIFFRKMSIRLGRLRRSGKKRGNSPSSIKGAKQ